MRKIGKILIDISNIFLVKSKRLCGEKMMNKKEKIIAVKKDLLKVAASLTVGTIILNNVSVNAKASGIDNKIHFLQKIETFDEEKDLEFDTYREMCNFYSKVFELKEDVIYNKIEELISEEPYAWTYANVINEESYQTKDQAIARTVYNIYRTPEDFNLIKEDIINENGYLLEDYLPEEFLYKFSMVLDVNPYLAMSIGYCECGRKLDSTNFIKNHNIGGITGNNGYIKYLNEAEGIFRFIIMLHDNYHVNLQSGKKKISSMASTYCSLPDHWNSTVSSIYSELLNYGFDYSYKRRKLQNRY